MKYKISLETLTPLHIGSGTELLANFDYLADDKHTYILDQDAIYAHELEQNGPEKACLDKPAGELIAMPSHERLSHFVRYPLQGATPKDVERIHEQIKDVYGRCYLPGSSLKGAIRRAMMVWSIGKGEVRPEWKNLKPEKGRADDRWDKLVFGRDPNHDILRLLQVTDSQSLPAAQMIFCQARVFQYEADPGSPIDLEAVAPGVTFESDIQVDELTLQYTDRTVYNTEADKLDWDKQVPWLTILPQILRHTSLRLLESELQITREWGWELTAKKYAELMRRAKDLPENTALLQVGWGGGWLNKTVGPVLGEEYVNALRMKYNLGKPPKTPSDWQPNLEKPFPNSRRLRSQWSVVGKDQPAEPLGWVQVTFTPLGEPRRPDYWHELRAQAAPVLQRVWQSLKYNGPLLEKTFQESSPDDVLPYTDESRLKWNFPDGKPQKSDWFLGIVFDMDSQEILLEIPGLNPDEKAYAIVLKKDLPTDRSVREGDTLTCQAIAFEKEYGIWRVQCLVA